MTDKKRNLNMMVLKVHTGEALDEIETRYRNITSDYVEIIPYAKNTPYREIAETIIQDHNGPWKNDLHFIKTVHRTTLGIQHLCLMANEFLLDMKKTTDFDILSISAYLHKNKIILRILVRPYSEKFIFSNFFSFVGDSLYEDVIEKEEYITGNLIIPDEIKNFSYSEEEIKQHESAYKKQTEIYEKATKETPFLNSIDNYIGQELPNPSDKVDLIYDLITNDMKYSTISSYEQFTKIFREIMTYVNGVEYYNYANVMKGEKEESQFMDFLEQYIEQTYISTGRLAKEDKPSMMSKLYRSLFQLYIIQDLIDDPDVTDIKITAPDSIRARIKGKAYITNINFIDINDYNRFMNGIAIRNGVYLTVPQQTFTDTHDENYILRFSMTAAYVNAEGWPYLQIRKINRKKLLAEDLYEKGMFDKKLHDYLIDCAKTDSVVFAGPPGSGKTVCLNWFLEEAYEQSAEILVIQENDELFCYRKGVMFEHVVNYTTGNERTVNLEQLSQLALVSGANVFVIGESKGAEICSAITLANSGCRTAITIHSPSSTKTIDKMADLAMRGYAQNIDQAKRMLQAFQTIVYLEDFKIQEISKITGYDEENHCMTYKYIYRRENDK